MTKITDWANCYDLSWKGLITDEAFSHPAKFARGLIFRIIEYVIQNGLIQPGGTILDPFGGVALGGLPSAICGLSWIGVELEERFTTLARQNFIEWSGRLWCTCGENGNDYLCSMRESVSKVGVGSQSAQAAQNGSVLQPGLPQQISFFGQEIDTDSSRGDEGTQALEQGQTLESRDAPEIIREGDRGKQGKREEWKLERGALDSSGRLYSNSGERKTKDGAPALDGVAFRTQTGGIRVGSSQEWEQTGQSLGKSRIDDKINAHEGTSPEWDKKESEGKKVRDLRENVSIQRQDDNLRTAMQASEKSRILATARRQAEGKTCKTCGKLIVPFPVILQGDSRRLVDVIAGAMLVVSSPPYAVGVVHDGTGIDRNKSAKKNRAAGDGAHSYGSALGQLASLKEGDITAVISSPPFAGNTGGRGEASRNGIDAALFDRHSGGMKKGTGNDPANLDHLPMGQISAVIGSPPYADGLGHDTGHPRLDEKMDAYRAENGSGRRNGYGGETGNLGVMVVGSPPFAGSIGSDDPAKRGGLLVSDPKRAGDVNLTGSYGQSEGQLGAMVVGSPPYEGSQQEDGRRRDTSHKGLINHRLAERINPRTPGEKLYLMDYAAQSAEGNIATESGETFWAAARFILDQCYQILPANAAAVWVTKRYVKDGSIVDFPGQWQALCEACGFETVEIIRAWLVKRNGTQATIEGGMVSKDIARKSFFRRLAEKNGSPPIDYETILVTRKKGVSQ